MITRIVRAGLILLLLAVVGIVGAFVWTQARAWRDLREGKAALEADKSAEALPLLERCAKAWPESAEVHFLAARAARRTGDLDKARHHLAAATKHQWVPQAIELERVLVETQVGNLAATEKILQSWVANEHPDAPLIYEVLAPAYINLYQFDKAEQVVKDWLDLRPGVPLAWHCKAVLAEKKRDLDGATTAFEKELELAPDRHRSRLALAKIYLDRNNPKEALPHLKKLADAKQEDYEVRFENVRFLELDGKHDDALAAVDRVLEEAPGMAHAHHVRGKLSLLAGKPDEAISSLKRAIELAPFEPDMHYSMVRALEQKKAPYLQIYESKRRLEDCKDRLENLKKLAQQVNKEPENPEWRRRMAKMFFDAKQEEEGRRWLASALRVGPLHKPSHRDMAAYYDRKGEKALADDHRVKGREPDGGP